MNMPKRKKTNRRTPKRIDADRVSFRASVVDLFCGAGGLSYGFKSQSFRLAAGIDIDESCRFPYEENNKAPFLRKDVGLLKAREVEALFAPGDVRVLVGCAPCQPFSTCFNHRQPPMTGCQAIPMSHLLLYQSNM